MNDIEKIIEILKQNVGSGIHYYTDRYPAQLYLNEENFYFCIEGSGSYSKEKEITEIDSFIKSNLHKIIESGNIFIDHDNSISVKKILRMDVVVLDAYWFIEHYGYGLAVRFYRNGRKHLAYSCDTNISGACKNSCKFLNHVVSKAGAFDINGIDSDGFIKMINTKYEDKFGNAFGWQEYKGELYEKTK